MGLRDTAIGFIPKIGDGISWVTQQIIQFLSGLGIDITALQTKILLTIVFLALLYLVFSVMSFTKKLIKWGLFVLLIILTISIIASMF